MRNLPLFVFASLLMVAPSAVAQSGSLKWCSPDGSRVVYSNSGVAPNGFRPCTQENFVQKCDASGAKFIGKESEVPYGFLDCSSAPRIVVNRTIPTSVQKVSAEEVPKREANKEYRRERPLATPNPSNSRHAGTGNSNNEESDPTARIQDFLQGFQNIADVTGLKGAFGKTGKSGKSGNLNFDEEDNDANTMPSGSEALQQLLQKSLGGFSGLSSLGEED